MTNPSEQERKWHKVGWLLGAAGVFAFACCGGFAWIYGDAALVARGRVVESDSAPIAHVIVTLQQTEGPSPLEHPVSAQTDAEGRYEIVSPRHKRRDHEWVLMFRHKDYDAVDIHLATSSNDLERVVIMHPKSVAPSLKE